MRLAPAIGICSRWRHDGSSAPAIPCALRFENVIEGKFKLIPRDARPLPDFQMSDAEWEELALPISLAFFFYDTPNKKMAAYYPSPAGATESLLPLTAWEALVAANPVLSNMRPDVETLLVNRVREHTRILPCPDRCLFRARRIDPHSLARFLRRRRGVAGDRSIFRAAEG